MRKALRYNGEKYAKLKDGSTINLYYKDHPRHFYKENDKWFIDHDDFRFDKDGRLVSIAYLHDEIVEFLNEKIIDNDI